MNWQTEIENYDIEYKTAKNQLPKSIWETYSAFANTEGGLIILGYDERSNEWTGVDDPIKLRDDFLNTVNNPSKVSFNVICNKDIIIEEYKDVQIVIIKVNEATYSQKPVYLNSRLDNSYLRLGDGDRLANQSQLKAMITGSQEEVDTELLNNYDLNDLNLKTLDTYKEMLVQKSGNKKYDKMDYQALLIEIGAYKKDRSNNNLYKMTTGCLLFFGKYQSIRDRFPGFQLDYFEKSSSLDIRWDDRVSTGDMQYPDLNVFDFLLIVMDKLSLTTKDAFKIDSQSQLRLPFKKDLSESIREALVNSLMHAYYDADFPIKITTYQDYYEFINPGEMRITVPEFILGGTSKIRNTTISTFLRRIGISEKAGSGGPKIFDVAEKYSLRLPEISRKQDRTIVRIWKVDLFNSLSDLEDNEQMILKFIIENGSIARKQMIQELELGEYQYTKAINALLEQDLIIRLGNGPGTRYELPKNAEERAYAIKKQLKNIEDNIS